MRFSTRLDPDLSPGGLQQALDRQRAEGAPLLDLTCSNPPECGLGPSVDALAAALAAPGSAQYHPEPRGLLGARQAVARYYDERGVPTRADDIFLSASTSQSYAELIKLVADPGDEILIPRPSYPLFDMLVRLEGCRPVPFPSSLSPQGRWSIDVPVLSHAFTPRTRAVILVSPNNPTGAHLAADEFAAIQQLCAARGCPIVLDEVFCDYPAEGVHAPALGGGSGLVARLNGLSKVVGAPQLKLGWLRLGGEEALVRAAAARLEFIADTYLSASTPAQLAAESLLPARGPIQARIRERLNMNQASAEDAFERSLVTVLPREGGWYLVLRLPEGEDEDDLSHQLLVEDHIVLHPGYFYDFPQGEHLVLSLLPPANVFAEGARRVAERVAARAQHTRMRVSRTLPRA